MGVLRAGGKGGRGGRVGGEDAAGVGDGAEASERGSSAAAGGRAVSPQPPTPSLSPLLSVTKVQENYANEDKQLSQRGSLPGLYFFGIRLRNYLTPCSEHFQLRGKGKRTRRREFPRLWAVYLTCHPQAENLKASL